jgi:hypothetical protein
MKLGIKRRDAEDAEIRGENICSFALLRVLRASALKNDL